YDETDGGLIRRFEAGDDNARKIAAVLQRVRPDLVLLNEFDYDPQQRAADLFQRNYLEVAQPGGGEALRYPYRYLAPVNTGVPSGLDLDGDGKAGDAARNDRARGNDAWGYGLHPGQYGMLVLSKYPIDTAAVRSFQTFKWSHLPNARQP
ncbi:endonuclease/exonuclease/phosphatase family protein, partial [Streptomyces sp. S12]|nr:endonuclease/exonuclease/phosphatase family protein [Streptomyces sp. S12]